MSRRSGRQMYRNPASMNVENQSELLSDTSLTEGHDSDDDRPQPSKTQRSEPKPKGEPKPKRMSIEEANKVWEKNINDEQPPAPSRTSTGGSSRSHKSDGVKFNPKTAKVPEGGKVEEGLIKTSKNRQPMKRFSREAKAAKKGEEIRPGK